MKEWTQGITFLLEVETSEVKDEEALGGKKLEKLLRVALDNFFLRKASPNTKTACKNCWDCKAASFPLLTPEKEMG